MVVQKIFKALQSRSPKVISGNHYKPAAVLIPIQEREDGDYLILTKRAERMSHHSGQVAFPGGRVDAGDRSAAEAALRESHEEIGIVPVTCGYWANWISQRRIRFSRDALCRRDPCVLPISY